MNNVVKGLLIGISIALGLTCCLYVLLGFYYQNGFAYGTYINGIYCTGKSIDEVADILDKSDVVLDNKARIAIGDAVYGVDLDKIDYHTDYKSALEEYIKNQNSFLWILNLTDEKSSQIINPGGTFDEDKLAGIVDSWIDKKRINEQSVKIVMEDDSLVLFDGKKDILDSGKAFDIIKGELESGNMNISIGQDCYKAVEYSASDKQTIERYDSIREFLDKEICFDFGDEKLVLSDSQKMLFLQMDSDKLPLIGDDGGVVYDEARLVEAVGELLNPYNTYQNHIFTTHNGRHVYLSKGTYGNKLDISKACADLDEAIIGGANNITIAPVYLIEAKHKGLDDIGDTYVEVSIDEQHIYYFENGRLRLDSDVVTGKKNRSDTPEVVCDVYFKQRNRTLVGETYRSFVKYWIAVYNHIGIHDASWRSEFGGNLYDGGGSHGCINTPTDKVSELYDILEEGTPVIIYSYEKSGID